MNKPKIPARVLRLGMRGKDVALLQKSLNETGDHKTLREDGVFGPDTAETLKEFQVYREVPSERGSVGPATWTALTQAIGERLWVDLEDLYLPDADARPGVAMSPAERKGRFDALFDKPSDAAAVPAKAASGSRVMGMLTRKYGPLPVYGWGLGALGTIALGYGIRAALRSRN